ncbi:nuclear transport factor 2 family protein [Halomarina rubra]|uniref:Nuclear transport factor 2 family protein n=1 Tax=Halomarina rubra TaxID=2071873 RepID=A0ABD6AW52_9EURY|nr:nuclear transport factor 2 family protein [Halomarina rubra]
MDLASLARAYYRHVDDGEYDALADLLAASFVHDRPDRTIESRERFVRFMREERPETDTSHELDAVYSDEETGDGSREVAVRGRLLRADGSEWFGFVDVFTVEAGRFARLTTYTH